MKKSSIFLLVSMISAIYFSTFAVDVSQAPKLEQATNNTLKIHWEKVEGALGYYVYYGKTPSPNGKDYESSIPDFIESTGATITGLSAGTDYYVAIGAADEEGIEGIKSPEAKLKTLGTPIASGKLAVKDAVLVSKNEIKLTFNNNINGSSGSTRQFKVKDVTNGGEILVTANAVSGNTVQIILAQDINTSTKYEITVLSIEDVSGKSIEAGVDGIITLTTPAILPEGDFTEDIGSVIDTTDTTIDTDLNSAGPEDTLTGSMTDTGLTLTENNNTSNTLYNGNAGQNIQVDNTTASQAVVSNKLPQTGPEHIILLILSLIIGTGVFYYTRKYQTNN